MRSAAAPRSDARSLAARTARCRRTIVLRSAARAAASSPSPRARARDAIEHGDLLLEAREVLGLQGRRALRVAPVDVGAAPRARDLLAVEQQAREQLQILHLSPARIEAATGESIAPERERRADHEVAARERAQPGFARDPPRLPGRHEASLDGVGEREARAARGVHDLGVAAHRDGGGVRIGERQHHVAVVRAQPVVGVEQRHELGGGEVEAAVPVGGDAERRVVGVVRDARVVEARHQLRDAAGLAAVVDARGSATHRRRCARTLSIASRR